VFFFLVDTETRMFELVLSSNDLQTDRARNVIAVPFFVSGGNGLRKEGPDVLASYAFGPRIDQINGGVTNLRNEQVQDVCSEINSISVQQAYNK